MTQGNAFPIDLPDIDDPDSLVNWQLRMVERLEFSTAKGITTGDAITNTVLSLSLETLTVYFIESWIMGILTETTGSNVPGLALLNIWRGGFKLDGSNVAQIVAGTAVKAHSSVNQGESAEPWTTNLTTDGNNVIQTVTGIATDLIRWQCKMKIFKVGI